MSLAGKRIFITGGSRGIGLAIALRAAKDGASIAIAAKTSDPNPKLPGTIHTAAAEIEAAGGKALAIQCDLRDETHPELRLTRAVMRVLQKIYHRHSFQLHHNPTQSKQPVWPNRFLENTYRRV